MAAFLCEIPGTDGPAAAWHAVVQLGLTAFVVVAGGAFLAAAIVAYRRSATGLPPRV